MGKYFAFYPFKGSWVRFDTKHNFESYLIRLQETHKGLTKEEIVNSLRQLCAKKYELPLWEEVDNFLKLQLKKTEGFKRPTRRSRSQHRFNMPR